MSDLTHRYGSPRRGQRTLVLAVVALVVTAGLAWLVWAIVLNSSPQVRSAIISFDVRGQHQAVARYSVVRSSREVRASCLLRAYAEDHSVVGERNVAVGPEHPASATLTSSVRTEREATSVDLIGCTTAEQKRPQ